MMSDYHFGSVVIDGKVFRNDIVVYYDGKVENWERKEHHLFRLEDIKQGLEINPEVVVFGTGDYGMAKVDSKAKEFIEKAGIEMVVQKTGLAIESFNRFAKEGKKVIGFFHLTC